MDRSIMWERIGAATGIAFVAFLLASFLVIPEAPPALDDPIADIRSFFVDHSSAFQASAYLTGLAGLFFLFFLGSLGTALDRATPGGPERRVVIPAGAIQFADAPPDISTSTRSSGPAASARASVSNAPASPAASGTGCPASMTRTDLVGRA